MDSFDLSNLQMPQSGSQLLAEPTPDISSSSSRTGHGGDDLSLSELSLSERAQSKPGHRRPFSLLARPESPDESAVADGDAEESEEPDMDGTMTQEHLEKARKLAAKTREEKLQHDLFTLKKLNAAFEVYKEALRETKSNTDLVAVQLQHTNALLDKYVRILDKSEKITKLILDERWQGAEADEEQLDREEQEAEERAQREEEERILAEQRERERREREQREREEKELRERLEREKAETAKSVSRGSGVFLASRRQHPASSDHLIYSSLSHKREGRYSAAYMNCRTTANLVPGPDAARFVQDGERYGPFLSSTKWAILTVQPRVWITSRALSKRAHILGCSILATFPASTAASLNDALTEPKDAVGVLIPALQTQLLETLLADPSVSPTATRLLEAMYPAAVPALAADIRARFAAALAPPLLPDIARLARVPYPGAAQEAYAVLLELVFATDPSEEEDCTADAPEERIPFDKVADEMLLAIAERRKAEEGAGFVVGAELEGLKNTAAAFGWWLQMEAWFAKSIALLEGYAAEQGTTQT
ncbi:hypothetical protein VTO73DRAFT_9563 [Trametes versicolor]